MPPAEPLWLAGPQALSPVTRRATESNTSVICTALAQATLLLSGGHHWWQTARYSSVNTAASSRSRLGCPGQAQARREHRVALHASQQPGDTHPKRLSVCPVEPGLHQGHGVFSTVDHGHCTSKRPTTQPIGLAVPSAHRPPYQLRHSLQCFPNKQLSSAELRLQL